MRVMSARAHGALIAAAVVLSALGLAALWVPWLPVDDRVECGWTCYVPLIPGRPAPRVLEVTGRGGLDVAGPATALALVATALALVAALVRGGRSRWGGVLACLAGTVALGLIAARVVALLRMDLILEKTGPDASPVAVAAAVGPGAVLAAAAAVGSVCLGAALVHRARSV